MALTQISTGMLASGDGTVDLNIDNGTFVVDVSTSRVGVGNTTPSVKLDITGDMKLSGAADFNGSLDVDGVTNLDVVDIDGAVNMATTALVTGILTTTAATVFNGGFASNAAATITTADNTTTLNLISTDTDANAGPHLRLSRNVTGADNDALGQVEFLGKDDAGNDFIYAQIEAYISDASNNSEDGYLEIFRGVGGTERVSGMILSPTDTVFNENSADIDFRIESDGNTNAFFLEGSSGNTGIGTASLGGGRKLTVAGGAIAVTGQNTSHSASSMILGQDSTALSQIRFYGANTSTPGVLQFTGSSSDASAGGERMRIDASGNVGIGTAAPVHRLHIADASTSRIQVTNNTSGHTNADGYAIGMEGTTRLYHWLYENSYMVFATNNAERVRIAADGKVGIGVTDPDSKLEIVGATSSGAASLLKISNTATHSYSPTAFIGAGRSIDLLTASNSNADSSGIRFSNPGGSRETFLGVVQTGGQGDLVVQGYSGSAYGERVRFKANGDLSIVDGNLLVASGHGIDFSATGDASGKTSELFDDYEEGTWTPALNSGSLGVVTALYRKIGNQVTVQFYVNNIAPNSNTLTLKIDGLPYTAQNVSNYYASGSISYSGNAVTGGHGILVPYNAAYIYFHLKSGSGAPAVTNNNWIATVGSGQPLIASITYFTA